MTILYFPHYVLFLAQLCNMICVWRDTCEQVCVWQKRCTECNGEGGGHDNSEGGGHDTFELVVPLDICSLFVNEC